LETLTSSFSTSSIVGSLPECLFSLNHRLSHESGISGLLPSDRALRRLASGPKSICGHRDFPDATDIALLLRFRAGSPPAESDGKTNTKRLPYPQSQRRDPWPTAVDWLER
jgi:hypothetical protein